MTRDLSPLFDPAGVVVAGASTHPGKFGFVALHNILASGYEGRVFATNLEGEPVLGVDTVASIDEIPSGAADLVFVCTPGGAVPEVLRQAAGRGIRAAFVTSAGYREAGDKGRAAEDQLVVLGEELGMVIAGPNGQGVVSTPSRLCAQIVAPYPPAGSIGVVSQSGNLVSSFLNLSRVAGVGVSRAISAGNAAMLDVSEYLSWYGDDAETSVALAYVEGMSDGRAFAERVAAVTAVKPVVLLKGGATSGGQQAAASHTGSLATDDKVFDGAMRQAGAIRAHSVDEAFEAAATMASQPLPRGPRVAVVTTAGGWGVLTADALAGTDLELIDLPDDLRASIGELVPPRWSRANPIDLAGGETRDTVPEVLSLVASHDTVDAVIFLGIGIQSNQARLLREGPFYPDHGIERIAGYHERQDQRYARAAVEVSETTRKPVLVATELAVADPANPGPATLRASGRLCYPSAQRAVTALAHAWDHTRRNGPRSERGPT
ncbi:MAG: CoA-binding protein [Acidimicrobiia bacterium]|nr:CoA-binding protein [Acidimicrobiia bacterium]